MPNPAVAARVAVFPAREVAMDDNKISQRVKWGVIGLLLVCAVLAAMLWKQDKHSDSALWFVGLLVLTATALTLTAIVFGGLKLNDANEAFGLPSGSVRTLLAVGVMVLFAVFGLKFFGDTLDQAQTPRPSDKPFEQVEVPVARLEAELERYKQVKSVLVVVASPGRAAAGNDAGANARLSLYTMESRPSTSALDAQKQLLTAIITLLTTVVGFYFGSKSAGDGMRGAAAAAPTDPGAQQRQAEGLASDRDGLEAQIKAQRETLERLKAQPTPEGGPAPGVAAALAQALDLDGQLDTLREKLSTALTAAQAKLAAVAAAPAGGEAAARDAAQQALAQASAELQALKQATQAFADATTKLLELTAKG
ncbi:small-conductance mechanosensitive channel [Pelomonas saccharophila]|uniref:Small-conductance mechanosensitive channel n=1 Tax=Roseateles saccharophilus TaxID=304 RepID=A0ABU1YP58_ROSSA|nr:hypothetical protein [Roseateles saccharophilus]MDR7270645.1 small-conductance mechanosensitive channel [Roseateles saccharophilus]